jgi:hypothetical protein
MRRTGVNEAEGEEVMAGLAPFVPGASETPISSPLAAANPISGNSTLEAAAQIRQSAGNVDVFNMFHTGMNEAKARMEALQAQLGPAGDLMNQGQAQLMERLKANYSPERESQLNWQALGNMGAAMMKPAEYGGHNQWSAGQAAYQDQRNKNQAILDQAGDSLAAGQAAAGKDDYARILDQYKLEQQNFKDNRAGIADHERAMKTAMGSPYEWKVGPGGMWRLEKQTGKSELIDKNNFTPAMMAAYKSIIDEANKQDDAFMQAANGDAKVAQEMKQQWIDSQMAKAFELNPSAAPAAAPTAAPAALRSEPSATAPMSDQIGPDSYPQEGFQGVNEKPRGLTKAEVAAYTAAAMQGDKGAQQLLDQDAKYKASGAYDKPRAGSAAPVKNTPKLEKDKEKNKVIGESEAKAEISIPNVLSNAAQTLDLINQVDTHPGKEYSIGYYANLPVVEGTPQAGFNAILDQIKNKAFLQAFESLKSAGAITDTEGQKATNAITRIKAGLPPKDFQKALEELRELASNGIRKAYEKAGMTMPEGTIENAQPKPAPMRTKTIKNVTYEEYAPGKWRVHK